MDDVRAVMAAVGSERAALFGCHTGGRRPLGAALVPDVHQLVGLTGRAVRGIRSLGPVDIRGLLGTVRTPVLFTDIVDSTRLAAELGDRRWHRVLVGHQEAVRRQLARFRGREVKTTADGFLATFDGPARAIRAADAIRAGLCELELEVRVGLHTGEVERLGEDIGGIAVHIAARVMAAARAGEILCSRTVKDLVAGAGYAFAGRGTHRLKGVPDSWELYAVELATA